VLANLRRLSGNEVCAILREHGFTLVRQKGSHMVMQRQIGAKTTTVPVPNHKEVRIGTLLSIIRQSGLARKLFETH
jgi:predicted RNA binding protein YcfA (HicA-like mRNA interferase family)